ncbi:MAG: DHHA1 domain-containing protein, partial [Stellaceae bacterium]
ARKSADKQVQIAKNAAAELKAPLDDMPARVAALLDERKKLERELSEARKKLAMGGGGGGANSTDAGVRQVNGVKLITRSVSGISPKDLPSLIDEGKKQIGSGIVAIVAVSDEGRAGIAVGVTQDLTKTFSAVELVRKGAEALGGKGGGGRPDMAQAGGPDPSQAEAALAAIERALAEKSKAA